MKLFQALKSFPGTSPITALTSVTYPVLFSSLLIQYFKQHSDRSVVVIDPTAIDFQELRAQLATTFLGQSVIYWLGDIASLPIASRKQYRLFLLTYQGPHQLIFWVDELADEERKKIAVVELMSTVHRDELIQTAQLLLGLADVSVLRQLATAPTYDLEYGLLLAQYGQIMSRTMVDEFNKKWGSLIQADQTSLFSLSSAFFARNQQLFYAQLHKLSHEYPPMFWITFWSEQLFRAAGYIPCARASDHQGAKKIAYRLPFTFIKNGWQQFSSQELHQAHDFLYEIDYTLKNGGHEASLDLFYLKFLAKAFG